MGLLSFIFPGKKESSASLAKDRLQIIIASERSSGGAQPDFMAAMQAEILAVIRKYVQISPEDIKITKNKEGDLDVLDVNVLLPAPSQVPSQEQATLQAAV